MASEGLRYTSNVRASRNLTGDSRASSLTCLSSFSIDDLVVVILLEYDCRLEEDGAQAISEVSEDTTTTIVNVSRPSGTVISIPAGRDVREEVGTPSFTSASLFDGLALSILSAHHSIYHLQKECRHSI